MPDATDDQLWRHADAAYREPFRLADGPPLRVVLLRCSPTDALLLVVAHHLVTDATSQWLLLRDLLAAYRGLTRSGSPDWRPLTASYRDYAEEERALLASAHGARLAGFWEKACAGAPPGALPTHPFALLLGAFQGLLHRYGGQDDFLVGCPSTVRLRPAVRDVVGHFVNTVPLRATLGPDSTLAQTVAHAGTRLSAGLVHVRYPCAALALPGRRAPLFHTALTLLGPARLDPPLPMPLGHGPEGAVVEHAGLRVSLVHLPQQEAQLDLLVEVVPAGAGLRASFRYSTDLLDEATVRRLSRHFEVMVDAAVRDPGCRVAAVPLIDESELAGLLALGAGTATA